MYEAPAGPQPIGGVLDNGFRLYGASIKGVFPLAVLASVVSAPFSRFGQAVLLSEPPGPTTVAGIALGTLIVLALVLVIYGAIIARIGAVSRSSALAFGEALGVGWRRGPALLGASFFSGVVIIVGLCLLLIPGVVFMVALAFAFLAPVTERLGPIASLQYSWRIVRGHWWRTACLLTIMAIIAGVLYVLLGVVVGIAAALNVSQLLQQGTVPWYVDFVLTPLIAGLVAPLVYSLWMAVFNDLKLRYEGGDIAERVAAA